MKKMNIQVHTKLNVCTEYSFNNYKFVRYKSSRKNPEIGLKE